MKSSKEHINNHAHYNIPCLLLETFSTELLSSKNVLQDPIFIIIMFSSDTNLEHFQKLIFCIFSIVIIQQILLVKISKFIAFREMLDVYVVSKTAIYENLIHCI